MPAERAPGKALTSNPPFPRQILNLSSPLGIPAVKLLRGRITREYTNTGFASGQLFNCNFLYNPSTLSVSHTVSTDTPVLPPNARDPADPYSYILPIGSTASFSLLFDRTYDLMPNSGHLAGTTGGHQGVELDISALYYIVGLKELKSGDNRLITSPPLPNTVFVLFGGPDSLRFYGYISSLNVAYTHWTQYMVPVRATAAITLTLFPYKVKISSPGVKTGIAGATASGTGTVSSHPQAGSVNAGRAGNIPR